jgi:hypothetical protein
MQRGGVQRNIGRSRLRQIKDGCPRWQIAKM